MDPASNHLRAELLPRDKTGWAGVRHYAAAIGNALIGELATVSDLVVTKRDSGAEVMRTPANLGSPEVLLDQVNADLESKTVAEFLSEWRRDADPSH